MQVTPVPLALAHGAAPAYYATRLASVLLVHRDGRVRFVERDVWVLDPCDPAAPPVKADPAGERVFRFTLDGW